MDNSDAYQVDVLFPVGELPEGLTYEERGILITNMCREQSRLLFMESYNEGRFDFNQQGMEELQSRPPSHPLTSAGRVSEQGAINEHRRRELDPRPSHSRSLANMMMERQRASNETNGRRRRELDPRPSHSRSLANMMMERQRASNETNGRRRLSGLARYMRLSRMRSNIARMQNLGDASIESLEQGRREYNRLLAQGRYNHRDGSGPEGQGDGGGAGDQNL